MNSRNRTAIGIGLTALTAAAGLAFADQLPARTVIHFGPGGQPNNYAAKPLALGFVPVVQLAMLGLFGLLPRIDPLGGVLFPDAVILFLVVPVTAVAIFATVYSYRDYRRKANDNGVSNST